MILVVIVLTAANVAAIWAWSMAEGKLRMEKESNMRLSLGHSAMARERDEYQARLLDAVKRYNYFEDMYKVCEKGRIADGEMYKQDLAKLAERVETLQNEIDGLNVDKQYLKAKLTEFETKFAKRRAQKTEAMRRLRAKRKESKG